MFRAWMEYVMTSLFLELGHSIQQNTMYVVYTESLYLHKIYVFLTYVV